MVTFRVLPAGLVVQQVASGEGHRGYHSTEYHSEYLGTLETLGRKSSRLAKPTFCSSYYPTLYYCT